MEESSHRQDTDGPDSLTDLVPIRTLRYVTKFELARVIGMRMLQLQESPPLQMSKGDSFEKIAIAEIKNKQNPSVIRRHLPDGTYEDCAVNNLLFDDDMNRFQLNLTRFEHR